MVHEQVSVVGTCFQCGKGMTEAEGGKIFTVCSQCWPNNPIANQQTMQGLQARVKELEGQNEQLQVQLAGCAVAALGGTKEPATRGMYGWSPAYQDVLDLRQRADRLQSEVERLKTISLCRCGDSFTAEDPGTCGNCLATYYQDRVRTGTVMAKVDR